jgi:hypothetical protein
MQQTTCTLGVAGVPLPARTICNSGACILIFKFNGVDEFAVKVYDNCNCRKTYHIDSDNEFDDSDEENM